MKSLKLFLLFINYVVTRPSLDHYREDSLVNPMLIFAFLILISTHFGHRETRNEVGFLSSYVMS